MFKSLKLWFRRLLGKPQFQHDCNACIFLGHTQHKETWYDLWACTNPKHPVLSTVIARWSSHGPDYTSGICFGMQALIEGRMHPLRTAIERAKEKGIDLGPEADVSRSRFCTKHQVKVAPGTECWDCGIEQMQERIKNNPRRSSVMEVKG